MVSASVLSKRVSLIVRARDNEGKNTYIKGKGNVAAAKHLEVAFFTLSVFPLFFSSPHVIVFCINPFTSLRASRRLVCFLNFLNITQTDVHTISTFKFRETNDVLHAFVVGSFFVAYLPRMSTTKSAPVFCLNAQTSRRVCMSASFNAIREICAFVPDSILHGIPH